MTHCLLFSPKADELPSFLSLPILPRLETGIKTFLRRSQKRLAKLLIVVYRIANFTVTQGN
jgi:hypothetical protein